MANVKISALNALLGSAAVSGDLLVIVDVSVPETKYITRAEFFKSVPNLNLEGAFTFNTAGAAIDAQMGGDTDANLVFLKGSTDRVGIGTNAPTTKLQVNGSFGTNAPVTVTANYTVTATDNVIINNRAASNTLTLPAAASFTGRILRIVTRQAQTVISASSNVVQKGGTVTTAILPATIGAWADLQSDGTNWVITAGGTIN